MNYLPYVSWGSYGAVSDVERAAYYASWGLLGELPAYSEYSEATQTRSIPTSGGKALMMSIVEEDEIILQSVLSIIPILLEHNEWQN